MDPKAQQARSHHRSAQLAERFGSQHRERRDALVRELYATGEWTYSQLAGAVGCSAELIAKIIRPQAR